MDKKRPAGIFLAGRLILQTDCQINRNITFKKHLRMIYRCTDVILVISRKKFGMAHVAFRLMTSNQKKHL